MNTTTRQKPVLIRDKIVWLACQIWQGGEGQADLKQESWRKAELLLVIKQREQGRSWRASE